MRPGAAVIMRERRKPHKNESLARHQSRTCPHSINRMIIGVHYSLLKSHSIISGGFGLLFYAYLELLLTSIVPRDLKCSKITVAVLSLNLKADDGYSACNKYLRPSHIFSLSSKMTICRLFFWRENLSPFLINLIYFPSITDRSKR